MLSYKLNTNKIIISFNYKVNTNKADLISLVQIYKINLKIAKCKNIMDLIKLSTIIYFKK